MRGRKGAMCRETVMQAEGDEQGCPITSICGSRRLQHHTWIVGQAVGDSPVPGGLRGRRRPRACPTSTRFLRRTQGQIANPDIFEPDPRWLPWMNLEGDNTVGVSWIGVGEI